MGQFSAPDAEKWLDWAGVGRHREHGQEAVAGFRWEVITWTMVGQWRWRQDTQGNISGLADGMNKEGWGKGKFREVSRLRSWRHFALS